ncbi:Putative adhesin [Clostridium collagenovorans DSM 3089]|uniref:Putative adhesin n=1 Tax=Clostridium collagenovorans DSM 3089 TaxID=1121306 RepID=A0A1M5X7L8_9CLOT|nr:DUF4097 family beta strand repeat-containing protein [Clostridium collagenovorans]SHH95825.1 Putative adhesin [Clostridium collagenovorans DSM 3089]
MYRKKKLVRLAGLLIVSGLILSIIGFVSGGNKDILWKDGKLTIGNSEKVQVNRDLDKFTDMDLNLSFSDIEVIKSDKYAIELNYFGDVNDIEFKVENEKLIVTDEGKSGLRFNINLNLSASDSIVKVYVPQDAEFNNLNISSSSGSIKLNEINSKKTNLSCDFGNVNIENLTSDSIEIEAKSGKVKGKNIKAKDFISKSDFGDIVLENVETELMKTNAKSGEVSLNNVVTDKFISESDFGGIKGVKIDSNELLVVAKSGDINLDGTFRGSNVIKNNFGDTTIKTALPKNDYSYNIDMSFGSCNIDGKKFDGDYKNENNSASNKFEVECKSGDFKLE